MQYLTFQQARAAIAHTAADNYTEDQLIELLKRLDYHSPIDFVISKLSLGYKLAWRLLPGLTWQDGR